MGRVHGDELQSKRRDAGKDGKFGTFCSVVINSKSLSTFLTRIRQYSLELYVIDQAFLYDNSAIVFMEQMCRILENQDINVDYSLTKGIQCNIGCEGMTSYESPFTPESAVLYFKKIRNYTQTCFNSPVSKMLI